MTFCGYHPAMSEGLARFGGGVATSTLKKAEMANRKIADHIEVELAQLEELIRELDRTESSSVGIEQSNRAKALKGLALVCQASFLSAVGITGEEEFKEHFAQQFAAFGQLVRELEDAFEGCAGDTSLSERTRVGVYAAITYTEMVGAESSPSRS